MEEWQKVDCFADGVIYACGNKRKMVTSRFTVVYYEVKGREVRWYRPASIGNPNRQKSNRPEAKLCRKSHGL